VRYLAENDFIIPIPHSADLDGFTDEALEMSQGDHGTVYMFPSYSCVNVMYSYDSAFADVKHADELVSYIAARKTSTNIGWQNDISNVWDIRYAYIDGYLDSHKHQDLYPNAYSADLDPDVVATLTYLRDVCVDTLTTPHTNPCVDETYFFNTDNRYYGDFASGRSVVLQGFPEYLSNILDLNPTVPVVSTAHLGDGNANFLYTNGFVVSKSNCGHSCHGPMIAWLNWSKVNHGLITSLGLDLTPQRPRYLLWSWAPFYELPQVKAYSHYKKFWHMQRNSIAQEMKHLLSTEADQHAALNAALIDGYTPP